MSELCKVCGLPANHSMHVDVDELADHVFAPNAPPEPSAEALELASRAMLGGPMQDKHMQYRVAAALQKLMDERDAHLEMRTRELLERDALRQRAEAAEAELRLSHACELEEIKRAEAAEKNFEAARNAWHRAADERDAVKTRLAECVREVREWNAYYAHSGTVEIILAKYEAKT